jgi:hypothetical protein
MRPEITNAPEPVWTNHPLGQKRQKDKRREPELKTVWENPFPQSTPEARAESLRVVAEAVADSEKKSGHNPGTGHREGA